MTDLYEYSIPDLVNMLGSRFKEYRLRSGMTQKDVATQSGITINTIHKFETGTAGNVSLSTFLSLIRAIQQIEGLEELMPELPQSAYLMKSNFQKVQRIRHKRS